MLFEIELPAKDKYLPMLDLQVTITPEWSN